MRPRNKRQGSVLLLTLLIVSLLLTLVLSFMVVVRLNYRTQDQRVNNVQAQQNARVALQIAIGELQKTAGPDQRITTTADAVALKDMENVTTPDPLFPTETPRLDVKAGGRFWTAVWGNEESDIGYDLSPEEIPPISGHQSGVTPVLLNWLVSGNEDATYEFHTNLKGGISSATGGSYQPSDINLSDPNNPTINGTPAVVLVGPNSVGTSSVNAQAYVAAPLVDIPSPTNGTPAGRYAWWVGDEGVKARMNLTNGYQQSQQADDEINSFLVAQRSGIEFMNRTPAGSPNPSTLSEYPIDDVAVSKLQNPQQLSLIATDPAAQAHLRAGQKNRFHDLSTYSLGVLSDVYIGGLKKDLTADIADTSSTSSGGYRPTDDAFIYPALSSAPFDPERPTWGLIRSWARTNPPSPGAAIAPIPPSPETAGVSPTIAYFSMGFNYLLDGNKINFALYPMISLHNPYPIPIAAADYEIGLRLTDQAVFTVQIDDDGLPEVDGLGNPVLDRFGNNTYSYDDVAKIDLNTCSLYKEGEAVPSDETFFRFKLKGRVIPPGERHIYILPDSQHGRTYSHTTPPVLERAPNSNIGIGESNYVVLEGPSLDLTSATPEAYIRLMIQSNAAQYTETSLALAQDEALAGITWDPENAGIYQAMNGVFPAIPHSARFSGATGSTGSDLYYCATAARGELISTKRTPPQFGNSAIRIATPYEARGWWSSQWKSGFMHGYYTGRPIADGSLRAPHIMATSIENFDPYPDTGRSRSITSSIAAGLFGAYFPCGVSDQGRDAHPGVNYYRYTTGMVTPDSGSSPQYAILWDLLDSPDRLLSLGQLQHVPFSKYDSQPSYLFGNSYALKRILRNRTYNPNKLRKVDEPARTPPTLPLYDESWHLNRAIWDQYFVSGVPSDLSQADLDNGRILPNARTVPYKKEPQLEDLTYTTGTNKAYDQAAANLMISGSFNINSTSEQAWRAILGGTVGINSNENYANPDDAVGDLAVYPRFSHNLSQSNSDSIYEAQTVTMRGDGINMRTLLLLGNRGLYLKPTRGDLGPNNSAQDVINELAHSIVQEIRLRGPFLSLSDFINRPLTAPPPTGVSSSTPQQLAGIKGVLQAGIDNMDPDKAQVNSYRMVEETSNLLTVVQARSWVTDRLYGYDDEHAVGGKSNNESRPVADAPAESYRARWSMAPKWITQADLLSTLGPMLSARSDTFIIRTYGEVIAQGSNNVEARAWCEAVVQRYPDYLDDSQRPTEDPTGLNLFLGRRFRIVSFRWLTPSDI